MFTLPLPYRCQPEHTIIILWSMWAKYGGGNVTFCRRLCHFCDISKQYHSTEIWLEETNKWFQHKVLTVFCLFFLILTYLKDTTEASGCADLSYVQRAAGRGINQEPVCITHPHSSGWTGALFSYLQHTKCTQSGGITENILFNYKPCRCLDQSFRAALMVRSCRDCVDVTVELLRVWEVHNNVVGLTLFLRYSKTVKFLRTVSISRLLGTSDL